MKAPLVLVVHKKYAAAERDLAHVRRTRDVHRTALAAVIRELKRRRLRFRTTPRGGRRPGRFDLVVTVGGDGTLLEAARGVVREAVLGVNSDPRHSVGRFCAADVRSFGKILDRYLAERAGVVAVTRLELRLDGRKLDWPVLNDVLAAHSNPAAMSHYILSAGGRSEHQRSSGLWIGTAAGSTGAMRSAGGRVQRLGEKRFQFRARELYRGRGADYRLAGGFVPEHGTLRVRSLMREGRLYLDGAHRHFAFGFGSVLEVRTAREPLRLVQSA
jgi:NAD+ kinase